MGIMTDMYTNLSLNHSTNDNLGWLYQIDKLSEVETERRRYPRNQAELEVTCTFYNPSEDDFEAVVAKVVDKSEAGLSFTTDRPLEMGMPLLIRLRQFYDQDDDNELKEGIHAQVVRCDEIFLQGKKPHYQAAVEYFELR
jgi:hypothetical protein